MRFLKLSAMVLFAICVGSLWAGAQTVQAVQPARQGQTKAHDGAQSHTSAKPQQSPLKIEEAFKFSRESLQKALQEARQRELFQPHRLLAGNLPHSDGGPRSFDDGIYLRQVDGAGICASIVSYNFSPGDNPQLENVTTCTPANAVRSIRARGTKTKKLPQGLRVIEAAFQKSGKK